MQNFQSACLLCKKCTRQRGKSGGEQVRMWLRNRQALLDFGNAWFVGAMFVISWPRRSHYYPCLPRTSEVKMPIAAIAAQVMKV
jgi:hypothetical protein